MTKKISLCYTTYNRVVPILESVSKIHDHPAVDEIIICDDASSEEIYSELSAVMSAYPKVRLFKNKENLDCYRNKFQSVSLASNEFVCLWDSDNVFGYDYLDKIISIEWDEKTILAPSFAKPHFDYRAYANHVVDKENVAALFDMPMFQTALNTCNFFVNRDGYLKAWNGAVDPVTSDSIYFCYSWLAAGNRIHIVDGLEYDHPISDDSHYKSNVHRTPDGFHAKVENLLRNLR
jgi:glycosyltransferase involved in cell wall biosynthesis